jgi:hypothetical protein
MSRRRSLLVPTDNLSAGGSIDLLSRLASTFRPLSNQGQTDFLVIHSRCLLNSGYSLGVALRFVDDSAVRSRSGSCGASREICRLRIVSKFFNGAFFDFFNHLLNHL